MAIEYAALKNCVHVLNKVLFLDKFSLVTHASGSSWMEASLKTRRAVTLEMVQLGANPPLLWNIQAFTVANIVIVRSRVMDHVRSTLQRWKNKGMLMSVRACSFTVFFFFSHDISRFRTAELPLCTFRFRWPTRNRSYLPSTILSSRPLETFTRNIQNKFIIQ